MLQTLVKEIDAEYLTTFHSITLQQVRKYLPHSKATVKGHLKSIKKGIKYSQIPPPSINNNTDTSESTPTIIEEYDSDDNLTLATNPSTTTQADPSLKPKPTILSTTPPNDNPLADYMVKKIIKPSKRTNYVYANYKPITGRIYTDQSRPVLIPSASGMKYVMVLYNFESNLIWPTTIPSKAKIQLITSYKRLFSLMKQKVLQTQLQIIDNECSNFLK